MDPAKDQPPETLELDCDMYVDTAAPRASDGFKALDDLVTRVASVLEEIRCTVRVLLMCCHVLCCAIPCVPLAVMSGGL